MFKRYAFLGATVLLPTILSLAQAYCGLLGLLCAAGGTVLGLAAWFRQRRQPPQNIVAQAQTLRHEAGAEAPGQACPSTAPSERARPDVAPASKPYLALW